MKLVIISCLLILAGCASQDADRMPLDSVLATCGGGFDDGVNAGLAASWNQSGGKFTAEFDDYARATILNLPGITSSDREKMYKNYVDCVKSLSQ